MRHHAKFCADRSRRCGDMSVFVFLDHGGRPPSWIFKKLEILTACTLQRVKVRHRAQFCADWSNRCGDTAVFLFFKMAVVRHLGFVMCLFGPPTKCILVVCVIVQNLV